MWPIQKYSDFQFIQGPWELGKIKFELLLNLNLGILRLSAAGILQWWWLSKCAKPVPQPQKNDPQQSDIEHDKPADEAPEVIPPVEKPKPNKKAAKKKAKPETQQTIG